MVMVKDIVKHSSYFCASAASSSEATFTENFLSPIIQIILLEIVRSVTKKEITRERASIMLITISMNETGPTKKIVTMFNTFILLLPYQSQLDDIEEADLSSFFILPTLQALFNEHSDDKHVAARLSSGKNQECLYSKFDISKRRPDGQIQMNVNTTGLKYIVGFNETKRISASKNHYKVNVDLLRLGIFGKNAIDTLPMLGYLC